MNDPVAAIGRTRSDILTALELTVLEAEMLTALNWTRAPAIETLLDAAIETLDGATLVPLQLTLEELAMVQAASATRLPTTATVELAAIVTSQSL